MWNRPGVLIWGPLAGFMLAYFLLFPLSLVFHAIIGDPWSPCGFSVLPPSDFAVMLSRGSIEELSSLPTAQQFLERYARTGTPVVVRGGVYDSMPRLKHWSIRNFGASWAGDVSLSCTVDEEPGDNIFERIPMVDAAHMFTSRRDLEKFTARLRRKYKREGHLVPYWAEASGMSCESDEGLPTGVEWVCKDMNFLPFLQSIRSNVTAEEIFFWMGPKGAITGTHFDIDPLGILHQVVGTKEVWLFPPWDNRVHPTDGKYEPGGRTALFRPFSEQVAGDASAMTAQDTNPTHPQGIKVILRAGDMLHIPTGWWHAVQSLTPTLSFAVRTLTPCLAHASALQMIPIAFHETALYDPAASCTCHDLNFRRSMAEMGLARRFAISLMYLIGDDDMAESISPQTPSTAAMWTAVQRICTFVTSDVVEFFMDA
jgi:hypothetical protein